MSHNFDPSMWVFLLIRAVENSGIDPAPLLKMAELTLEEMQNPTGVIPSRNTLAVFGEAVRLTGNPHIGIEAVKLINQDMFGLEGYSVLAQPTLWDALQQGAVNMNHYNSTVSFKLTQQETQAVFRFERLQPTWGGISILVEFFSCFTLQVLRLAAGKELAPNAIHFSHQPLSDNTKPLEAFFNGPVYFQRKEDVFTFPMVVLNQPTQAANPGLSSQLNTYMANLEAQFPKKEPSYEAQTCLTIRKMLGKSPVSKISVAHQLGLTPRSLKYLLKKEDAAFAALLEKERKNFARESLQEGVHANEVGYLLGYQHPSSFNRAFHRWFGIAPGMYFKSGK